MAERLYIARTKIVPTFLDAYYADDEPDEQQAEFDRFLARAHEQHPEIALPIMTFFRESGMYVFLICDDHSATGPRDILPSSAKGIRDLVMRYRIGENTIRYGETIPVKTVVEFQGPPHLEEAYSMLERQYEVLRVVID